MMPDNTRSSKEGKQCDSKYFDRKYLKNRTRKVKALTSSNMTTVKLYTQTHRPP